MNYARWAVLALLILGVGVVSIATAFVVGRQTERQSRAHDADSFSQQQPTPNSQENTNHGEVADRSDAARNTLPEPRAAAPAPVIAPAITAITSRRELQGCAEGEEITIRGKIGLSHSGIDDMLSAIDGAPLKPTVATPFFEVTFRDGTKVTCAFSEMPREDWERIINNHKPGTLITVCGKYYDNPFLVAFCKIIPNS